MDWTIQEISGLPHENDLLEVTASLASIFTTKTSLEDVLAALKDNHQIVCNTAA